MLTMIITVLNILAFLSDNIFINVVVLAIYLLIIYVRHFFNGVTTKQFIVLQKNSH